MSLKCDSIGFKVVSSRSRCLGFCFCGLSEYAVGEYGRCSGECGCCGDMSMVMLNDESGEGFLKFILLNETEDQVFRI